ncbi:MAG: hypothetical protein FWE62_01110 [Firmicutes bacterium]|nr:hypothetical protein [Bacillota bacterium]
MTQEQRVKAIQIGVFASVLLGVILVISLILNVIALAQATNERGEKQRFFRALEAENARLEAEAEFKSTDRWIQKYAREYQGMTYEGEKKYED